MSEFTFSTLKSGLGNAFDISQDEDGVWVVRSPLIYSDGDNLPLFISRKSGRWCLTDRGMTVSHLYFDEFEYSEARYRSIRQVVDYHYAEILEDYEVIMWLDTVPTPYDLGDFLQLISQIQVVAIVSQTEREQSTYMQTIRESIRHAVEDSKSNFHVEDNWSCPELESQSKGKYSIDSRIHSERNGVLPINVFAASTDYRTALSTLTMSRVRPFDVNASFILAIHPERVGEAAIARFEDESRDGDAVARVTPDDPAPLYEKLIERGLPISL